MSDEIICLGGYALNPGGIAWGAQREARRDSGEDVT